MRCGTRATFSSDALRCWSNLFWWEKGKRSMQINDGGLMQIASLGNHRYMIVYNGPAEQLELCSCLGEYVTRNSYKVSDPVDLAHFLALSPHGSLLLPLIDAFPQCAELRKKLARRILSRDDKLSG